MMEKTWSASTSGRFLLIRMIWNEWKRQCISITFLLGLCSVPLLMLLENLEVFANGMEEKYTLLSILVFQGKDWIDSNVPECWEELMMQQPGMQLQNFVTVLAALPFLVQFCNERKSGNLRIHIFRVGKWRYYLAKIISGMLSGGMMIGGGYALFAWILSLFFPTADERGLDLSYYLSGGFTIHHFLYCLFGIVCYGMAAAVLGIAMSAFTKDIYICLTFPFLIKWINHVFQSYLYVENEETITGTWRKMLNWWRNYGSLEQIIIESGNHSIQNTVLIFFGICLVGGAVFILRMNGRKDYGD